MSASLPFALSSGGLSSSEILGKYPCRQQKMLVSNLGLTALSSIWLNWLSRVCGLPSENRKKKRVKSTETSMVNWLNRYCSLSLGNRKKEKKIVKEIGTSWSSPFFVLYHSKSLHMLPLFS
jgi:hypothetical protein